MKVRETQSVAETEAFGAELAAQAERGWVIGLSGDLGAGKTAFVRGFARGLGFPGRVHSPTFALLNEYRGGRLPIHHLDLYRLGSAEEVRGAGLEVYLDRPEGVALVEWIGRWGGGEQAAGAGRLRHLSFQHIDEQRRRIEYDDSGA